MITDWDDAYQNGAYIAGAEGYPDLWREQAAGFRAKHPPEVLTYGPHPRETLDLFTPQTSPKGLAVFVHGGYWQAFGRRDWSHLAAGALAHGFAVAIPEYPLCPGVEIPDITRSIARAVDHAATRIAGPVHLSGHSAGGHLVTRLACRDVPLRCANRLGNIISISGVHDLRPLTRTAMKSVLRLDMETAAAESPALKTPRENVALACWAGADERPEFRRQNALLANIWSGCFIPTRSAETAGAHHFNIIESLTNPDSDMIRRLIDPHQGG